MKNLFDNTEVAFKHQSTANLKKAYWMFKSIDMPFLTKLGSLTMEYAIHLPGVKPIIEHTIFDYFCGGETKTECLERVKDLYEKKVYSILDYSVEGKESEKDYDSAHKEVLELIDLAKDNPAIPFVVFKPTAFGNIKLYEKVGKKAMLSDDEKQAWERVKERFYTVGRKAEANDVIIMADAEESWMQDAADDLMEELMERHNKNGCLVVNTLQMYRHDRLKYLKTAFAKAKEGSYYLGFKVVRGAYMEKERKRAMERSYTSPIQLTKEDTDRDYNAALDFIYEHIDRIALFAGTHNEKSCKRLLDHIRINPKPESDKHVWFGQLLGMSDNISFNLANSGLNVVKYVPYGPVKEVIPYLIRRAEENTAVAGQTNRELNLIKSEIKRREQQV